MKKFSRILAIVMALVMIFALAACSSEDGEDKTYTIGIVQQM